MAKVKYPYPAHSDGKGINKLRSKLTTGRTTVAFRPVEDDELDPAAVNEWTYVNLAEIYAFPEPLWILVLDTLQVKAYIPHNCGEVPDSYLIVPYGELQKFTITGGIGPTHTGDYEWDNETTGPMHSGPMPRRTFFFDPQPGLWEVTDEHFEMRATVYFSATKIEEDSWASYGSVHPETDSNGMRRIAAGTLFEGVPEHVTSGGIYEGSLVGGPIVASPGIFPTVFPMTFDWMCAFDEGEMLP